MAGRPSKYTLVLANEILKDYASGKTLKEILSPNRMPSRWAVYRWRIVDKEFDAEFLKACECNADSIVEEAFKGVMDGKSAPKLLDVQFKSSSWLAAKINRSKYGDKIDIDIKQTVDISPALALAVQRMKAIGTGQDKLIEAEVSE